MSEVEMILESEIKIEDHEISDDSCSNTKTLRSSYKNNQQKSNIIDKDSETLWLKHIEEDNNLETFYCNECTFETKWKSYLKNHIKTVHFSPDKAVIYYCHQCDFKSKWKLSLKSHMKIHVAPDRVQMHKCPQCDYQTRWKSGLSIHMKVHLLPKTIKSTIYKCNECEYECKNKIAFKSHVNLTHKVEKMLYKCPLCDFQTNFRHGVNKHVKIHNTTKLV